MTEPIDEPIQTEKVNESIGADNETYMVIGSLNSHSQGKMVPTDEIDELVYESADELVSELIDDFFQNWYRKSR